MTSETVALLLVLVAVIIITFWTLDRGRWNPPASGTSAYAERPSSQSLPAAGSGSHPAVPHAPDSVGDAFAVRLRMQPIPPEQKADFTKEWRSIQLSFVGDPDIAFRNADRLAKDVMLAAGLSPFEFERRADEIERAYPDLVRHFQATEVAVHANEHGEAQIEDLRQAMVHYRGLFQVLLELPSQTDSGQLRAVR